LDFRPLIGDLKIFIGDLKIFIGEHMFFIGDPPPMLSENFGVYDKKKLNQRLSDENQVFI